MTKQKETASEPPRFTPAHLKCLRCGVTDSIVVDGLCAHCEDELDDERPDGDGYCAECGGDGWIVTCCDDICHGVGYCIHGDGMDLCGCNIDGDKFPANAPANWKAPKDLRVRKPR